MSRTSNRLGRGLASLIPDSALDSQPPLAKPKPKGELKVPLDQITPNPEQPRKHFDLKRLEELSDSIRVHGILNPLVVRRHEGKYILIAGERRLRASALAGLNEVPVVVRDAADPKLQLELALIENLQRDDLDPVETALGYDRLRSEFGLKQDEIGRRVGKDRSTVANAMRLLKLPEFVLSAIQDGRISAGHARALLPLVDAPDDLRNALAQVIARRLNVRATEQLVSKVNATPKPIRSTEKARRDNTFDYATRLLTESLQTNVAIKAKKNGSGSIVINYTNAEELERLIQTLRDDG